MSTPVAEAPWRESAIRPITDHEFGALRDFIYGRSGIHLSAAKKALLVGRLSRRLRELGLTSFGAYYRHVAEGGDPLEGTRLIEAICTHETHFFREPRQFDFIEERVVPEWEADAAEGRRPRRVRVWSAGCSTGEEPYSLAMMLRARLTSGNGWTIEILGTDLSSRALEKARRAVWPIEKSAEIPAEHLRSFMLRGTRTQQGNMKAGPLVRESVRFERHNLSDAHDRVEGLFDLILCRNVLIYFNVESRSRVIHRLMGHLAPHGYLFLGHAETLNGITTELRSVGPTVYGWPSAPSAPR